jgi:hypothetical protein
MVEVYRLVTIWLFAIGLAGFGIAVSLKFEGRIRWMGLVLAIIGAGVFVASPWLCQREPHL